MALLQIRGRLVGAVFFVLFCGQINNPCYAQTIVNSAKPNEQIFLVRIKQFNEFLNRFNYKTDFNGNQVDSVFTSKISRGMMINSLFDLRDPRNVSRGNEDSQNYISKKTDFINYVVEKNLLVYRYSDKIIAEAKSRILFNGKPGTIRIFLSQEIVGKDMVKWVINTIKGDLFNFLKSDTTYVRFIPPSSNETDFMNLKRALEDTKYLQYYSAKDYEPDYLTVFYYLLNSGAVKFDYVEEVTYHILDVPGWCFKVREFNRQEMNSGWLIADLSRNSLDKEDYLKAIK